jgi:hypothetical protein
MFNAVKENRLLYILKNIIESKYKQKLRGGFHNRGGSMLSLTIVKLLPNFMVSHTRVPVASTAIYM